MATDAVITLVLVIAVIFLVGRFGKMGYPGD